MKLLAHSYHTRDKTLFFSFAVQFQHFFHIQQKLIALSWLSININLLTTPVWSLTQKWPLKSFRALFLFVWIRYCLNNEPHTSSRVCTIRIACICPHRVTCTIPNQANKFQLIRAINSLQCMMISYLGLWKKQGLLLQYLILLRASVKGWRKTDEYWDSYKWLVTNSGRSE